MVDLFADKLDRRFVRDDGYVNTFSGCDEFLTADDLWATATALLEIAAVSSIALATVITLTSAVSALATFSALAASTVFATVIAVALRMLALGGFVGVLR